MTKEQLDRMLKALQDGIEAREKEKLKRRVLISLIAFLGSVAMTWWLSGR